MNNFNHQPQIEPQSDRVLLYGAPHLDYEFIIPWEYDALWLCSGHIRALYLLERIKFWRICDKMLTKMHRYEADYTCYINVRKYNHIYSEKFYNSDFVIFLGDYLKSPNVVHFKAWVENQNLPMNAA